MIRGRAYHPQSQGSIEVANRTLKTRLTQYAASLQRKDWAALLSRVAHRINTTTSESLPWHTTPFDIWFGRSRHWIHQRPLSEDAETADEAEGVTCSDGGDEADDEADPVAADHVSQAATAADDNWREQSSTGTFVLTAHEVAVAAKNIRLHEHMRRKVAATAKSFEAGEVATLFIPKKQRLKTEQQRIPVRILDKNCAGHRLISRYVHLS